MMLRGLVVAVLLAVLPGCGLLDPRADPTRFYLLATSDELGETASSAASRVSGSVGLGPLELPSYVRRSELVERRGATRIEPLRNEHWGEPLDGAVARVLARDLELALGTKSIQQHPWYADAAPTWQVKLAFTRFERDESGRVIVAASWQVLDTATHSLHGERDTRIVREVGAGDAAATVRALSEALSELSGQIAGSFEQTAR